MAEKKFKLDCRTGIAHVFEDNTEWKGTKLKNNEKLTDSSGFVPLQIRIKKIELASAVRKYTLSQYDYRDYDEIFTDDISFDSSDDIESIREKIGILQQRREKFLYDKYQSEQAKRANEDIKQTKTEEKTPIQNTEQKDNKNVE